MLQLFAKLIRKIFGSRNDRLVKSLLKMVQKVNAKEEAFEKLSDRELREKTGEFRQRLADGETKDAIREEAFSVVREAAKRVHGLRHYDVQMVGGMVLDQGKIAEMRTGEGKTLVATLAAYLNALTGKGVHVVTVNDYLARRDGENMGRLYDFLGLTVGIINSSGGQGPNSSSYRVDFESDGSESGFENLSKVTRREAYSADITYGTNNEFGFDYLRDNMAFSLEEKVQRDLHYAIIDEVDSILIDEARTPLVISGPASNSSELYQQINQIAPKLTPAADEESEGDFVVDEKNRTITLTEQGHESVEQLLISAGALDEGASLYDPSNIVLLHHVDAALRAHHVFQRDVNYVVEGGEIVIIDEFTGRKMPGRRWSEGLHQAVEAKEGVTIQNENQTLASITYQNYFRLYDKLSGMTGTADTEAQELMQIYGLEVVVIPTNKPMIREDRTDQVFLTMQEKFDAIIADVRDCQDRGQPVLVGTASIEASEYLSAVLSKAKISHEVLNAKQHEREAHIVAQAGRPGMVTIATNMAGRGTDIVLGGSLDEELKSLDAPSDMEVDRVKAAWRERHEKVLEMGGLHIIGSERHESRRIDNQLRGRAGRQGDPGSSRFYLSMEDNLMRIFASDKVKNLMERLGMKDGEAIEHPWLNRAIENAQRKVEGHNYDMRKNILEYDDVANDQRRVIYAERADLMASDDISENIENLREEVLGNIMANFIPPGSLEERWNIEGLEEAMKRDFGLDLPIQKWLDEEDELYEETLFERLHEKMLEQYEEKKALLGDDIKRFEKQVMLLVLDTCWKEHLATMDHLRQGIGLRAYAQKNPKQEYKKEAFGLFQGLLDRVKEDTVSKLHLIQLQAAEQVEAMEDKQSAPEASSMNYSGGTSAASTAYPDSGNKSAASSGQAPSASGPAPIRTGQKVGRNEPCPCGSGKKYKHCHGKLA
ncbi:preprotein translocase, SecA subunit [gamma proteobacterium HTCC5015]|nr:preprotein translocase, SecA subunit [gamma proteobacterium HTCC5015]